MSMPSTLVVKTLTNKIRRLEVVILLEGHKKGDI